MNKLIIYGDIHGCYDELISLRNKINPQENDIEVCVGDIITKGKDSIKTLDYIIEHNIQSVLGNHEDKILRYLHHQQSNKKNPITLDKDEQNIVQNLLPKHIEYLQSMPLLLHFENIVVLHGGVQNHMTLENITKRDKDKILRLRYLDQDGHFVTFGKEDENSVFWADVYDGNLGFIVYGHQWFQEAKINEYSVGIDTGCVYGNKLSAVVFTDSHNFSIENVSCKPCSP
jgi:predicted phosphodiesterase